MTVPDGPINLIHAIEADGVKTADRLDREASDLEAIASTKRVEAFRLRALSRALLLLETTP